MAGASCVAQQGLEEVLPLKFRRRRSCPDLLVVSCFWCAWRPKRVGVVGHAGRRCFHLECVVGVFRRTEKPSTAGIIMHWCLGRHLAGWWGVVHFPPTFVRSLDHVEVRRASGPAPLCMIPCLPGMAGDWCGYGQTRVPSFPAVWRPQVWRGDFIVEHAGAANQRPHNDWLSLGPPSKFTSRAPCVIWPVFEQQQSIEPGTRQL